MTEQPKSAVREKNIRPGQFSLWDVITLMSGGAAAGNSWAATKMAGTRFTGTLEALFFGVLIGVCCIILIRAVGSAFVRKFRLDGEVEARSSKKIETALRVLYLFAAAWIIASGVIGYKITIQIIHLLNL